MNIWMVETPQHIADLIRMHLLNSDSVLTKDNSFRPIFSGEENFRSLIEDIRNARRFVYFQTYIMRSDTIGKELMELLLQKKREGLDVKLLIDGMGGRGLRKKAIKKLREGGVETEVFFPFFIPYISPRIEGRRNIQRRFCPFGTEGSGIGIINSIFKAYEPHKGEIPKRQMGSIIAYETTVSTTYGLYQAQERGNLFIGPGVDVYEGMVIGENPKGLDMEVNVGKKKQQTNMRAAGSDENLRLVPPKQMSLEEALEFIEEDELIEVTPLNIRVRKKILNNQQRYKSRR